MPLVGRFKGIRDAPEIDATLYGMSMVHDYSRAAKHNRDAMVRAVEENHQARMVGGRIVVVSDISEGLAYSVTADGCDDGMVCFTCVPVDRKTLEPQPWRNHRTIASPEPGSVCCKHSARAAMRLERSGLIKRDGHDRWTLTDKTLPRPDTGDHPADPFTGLT